MVAYLQVLFSCILCIIRVFYLIYGSSINYELYFCFILCMIVAINYVLFNLMHNVSYVYVLYFILCMAVA